MSRGLQRAGCALSLSTIDRSGIAQPSHPSHEVEVVTSTETESSEPSLPPAPVKELPNEIIRNILTQLTDDKDALSRCMRVSAKFNIIAAPILYHSIQIECLTWPPLTDNRFASGTRNPYYCPTDVMDRTVPTKIQNLGLIRHLAVDDHSVWDCRRVFGALALHPSTLGTFLLETLKFGCNADWSGGSVNHHLRWYKGSSECHFLQYFTPRRVVLFDIHPPQVFPPCPSEETVCVLSPLIDSLSQRRHAFADNPSSTMTYIFWTTAAHLTFLKLPGGQLSIRYPRDRIYWVYWDDLRARIVFDAWMSPSVKKVTIVNIDAIKGIDTAEGTLDDPAASLQEAVDSAKPNEFKKKPRFEIKFISMPDYLKKHDWRSVFEEEDVKGWLEEIGD